MCKKLAKSDDGGYRAIRNADSFLCFTFCESASMTRLSFKRSLPLSSNQVLCQWSFLVGLDGISSPDLLYHYRPMMLHLLERAIADGPLNEEEGEGEEIVE